MSNAMQVSQAEPTEMELKLAYVLHTWRVMRSLRLADKGTILFAMICADALDKEADAYLNDYTVKYGEYPGEDEEAVAVTKEGGGK